VLIIVQARTSSQRFPNKVLFKLKNKPIIIHVLNRLKKSKFKNDIVVSTSIDKSDDKLVNFLKTKKIKFFRGDLNNVAKRLYMTSLKFKKKFFIRVSADSPLIDTEIMDQLITIHKKKNYKNYDVITNVFPRTFSKGMSFEIIKRNIIQANLKNMSIYEKEHVTKFFYNNPKKFKIKNLINLNKKKYSIDLTVDRKVDLKKIRKYL
jgi:spore coat polysaccharide biosynthesis protein SpsF (cytidylyltransferase family)